MWVCVCICVCGCVCVGGLCVGCVCVCVCVGGCAVEVPYLIFCSFRVFWLKFGTYFPVAPVPILP